MVEEYDQRDRRETSSSQEHQNTATDKESVRKFLNYKLKTNISMFNINYILELRSNSQVGQKESKLCSRKRDQRMML